MTDPQHPRPEQYPSATPPEAPAADSAPVPTKRSGRARIALVAAAVVGLLAVGGGGFAVGRATAPETAATTSTTDQQFPGGGPMGTPPDGGQLGTPPGQDGSTGGTTDGTTSEPTT